MQPCVYAPGKGWARAGRNVSYTRTLSPGCVRSWYTLTFNLRFRNVGKHYLAYAVPYSRTLLLSHLDDLLSTPVRARLCTRSTLCTSLAGLPIEQVVITEPDENDLGKRTIVVSARVHPGETVASWMMHGFMCWAASDDPRAVAMRHTYKIVCVPMMNPGATQAVYAHSADTCWLVQMVWSLGILGAVWQGWI